MRFLFAIYCLCVICPWCCRLVVSSGAGKIRGTVSGLPLCVYCHPLGWWGSDVSISIQCKRNGAPSALSRAARQ